MMDEMRINQIKEQLELISTAMRGGTEDKTMHQTQEEIRMELIDLNLTIEDISATLKEIARKWK
jgi:hypothetical protein|tara:strand:- start:309 stop:500 length:192 start_codon:yes stop_codon:yes gene_type:complete